MRTMKKWILRIFVGLMVLLVILTSAAIYIYKTRIPTMDGTLRLPGLKAEVRVVRDKWAVPHIYAQNEADAYYALGYCMAQERLFQMEALRRIALGELSEVLGSQVVEIDKAVRLYRLRPLAEKNAKFLRENYPDVLVPLEAFFAGVNQFIEDGPMPLELLMLGVKPRPFTPEDALAIAALLPITFSYGSRQDPMFTLLQWKYPKINMNLLFPGYSKSIPATIMETLEEAEAFFVEKARERMRREETPAKTPLESSGATQEAPSSSAEPPNSSEGSPAAENVPNSDSPNVSPTASAASSRHNGGEQAADETEKIVVALHAFLDVMQQLSTALGDHMSSNSWVLAPKRTKNHTAILANDPHIGFVQPTIWFEAHLKYPDFENYGYYLPAIPVALLGHNQYRAWGCTMLANDDVDMYMERFDEKDPNKVYYRGDKVDLVVEKETINVRWGEPVEFEVRSTPHGPLVTSLLERFEDYKGPEVALWWVWQHVDYTDVMAFYRMGKANDLKSFEEAVSFITSPGINVSYADRNGNIAWWAAGKLPIRPAHVNSKMMLDGASGLDEIQGYLPFDQNPKLINPPSGYIVTANNKPTVKPVGPIQDLEGYWQPDDRAAQIEFLLEQRTNWTLEDLMAVQLDTHGYGAAQIVPAVLPTLEKAAKGFSPLEAQALEELKKWDRTHGTESIGATIYQVFCDAMLRGTVEDELGEKLFLIYGTTADSWNFLKYMVRSEVSPFWDNVNTPNTVETYSDIIVAAFKEAVDRIRKQLGDDVRAWQWGKIHTVEYPHPFGFLGGILRKWFNVGPYPAFATEESINRMLFPRGHFDYRVRAGDSTRRLIDMGSPEHSYTILPTGNSGHVMSPHYADQTEMFLKGEYRKVNFTDEQIEAAKEHELRLVPSS